MNIVALGDFHIPSRASQIPDWIISCIHELNPDVILCTGDLETDRVLIELKQLGESVFCVRGNMDDLPLPEHVRISAGDITIGVIHGNQVHPRGDLHLLNWYADLMNANILVHGHTHKLHVALLNGRLFVNPGTATGVWGGVTAGEPESFIEMIINGKDITINQYLDGDRREAKYVFNRGRVVEEG